MLANLRRILEMIRFSHTLFALPFALFAALLAWHAKGAFQIVELAGILLCMVFARSAAMAFNRLSDRDIDALNPRTARRHLPAGLLSVRGVWLFTFCSAAGFIAATFLFLLAEPANPWPAYLSAPCLAIVLLYSVTKQADRKIAEGLAAEYGGRGIRAYSLSPEKLVLSPGFMYSGINRELDPSTVEDNSQMGQAVIRLLEDTTGHWNGQHHLSGPLVRGQVG